MSRVAYVAGQYLPHRQAAVHIEDRGYQFGDGVYEVIAVMDGPLVDAERHLRRLNRSLTELRINPPMCNAALKIVMREVVRRNGVESGIVYLQVTRGVATREHAFPKSAKPVLVITSRAAAGPIPRPSRHRRDHDPRHPLAALRYQVDSAVAECPRQAAGSRGR